MSQQPFEQVGFIGSGRVTRFLLEGWQNGDAMPRRIRTSDANPSVLEGLAGDFPRIQPVGNREAAKADMVFLALHPPVMRAVLEEIQGAVEPSSVVVSLAPVVQSSLIRSGLGVDQVVRMIPNAASAIGRGYNPVCFDPEPDADTRLKLQQAFQTWGVSPEVSESELEAYAILAAMGPTYMWFQWQVLREMGQDFGLSPGAVDQALNHMIEGSGQLLFSSGRNPENVMNMIPVEPLKEEKQAIIDAYYRRLPPLFEKLRS